LPASCSGLLAGQDKSDELRASAGFSGLAAGPAFVRSSAPAALPRYALAALGGANSGKAIKHEQSRVKVEPDHICPASVTGNV
jgi:hypothetical protein